MIQIFEYGGLLMIPLFICSIVSFTIIIERLIFWTRVGIERNLATIMNIFDLCEKEDWENVIKIASDSKSYVAKILLSGILHREHSPVKAMELAASDAIFYMQRYMNILDTIITSAPLLGILGTVVGIIDSFDMLGISGIENPQAVTAGIAKALITTAFGLSIAVATVFPYNYFNARIERAAQIIEKYTTSFEIAHEKKILKPKNKK